MKDPEVNEDPENPIAIHSGYLCPGQHHYQPGTVSFAYDTRNASVDPTSGRELSLAVALAGLGGDVRTYQPTLSYSQFFPMRRKKSETPEVFGFRILAGTVGSFAISPKVRNSQSLAFVDGVPIFERFFLGDEFSIRGYNVRSISPIAPLDTFITSQKRGGRVKSDRRRPFLFPGCRHRLPVSASLPGLHGSNMAQLPRSSHPIGADTQCWGTSSIEFR